MKTCRSAAVVPLVLMFLPILLAPSAHAGTDAGFRPGRVRAFAPESSQSVVLREGRSRFVRLALAEDCPALATAQRVAFQVGALLSVANESGADVRVVRHTPPTVVSTETAHAHLVAIHANGRVACRIARVTDADRSGFDTAAAVHGSRDNRYAGDGRPGA